MFICWWKVQKVQLENKKKWPNFCIFFTFWSQFFFVDDVFCILLFHFDRLAYPQYTNERWICAFDHAICFYWSCCYCKHNCVVQFSCIGANSSVFLWYRMTWKKEKKWINCKHIICNRNALYAATPSILQIFAGAAPPRPPQEALNTWIQIYQPQQINEFGLDDEQTMTWRNE